MPFALKLRALFSGAALAILVVFPALADPEALLRAYPGASVGDLTGDGVLDAVVQPRRTEDLGAVIDGASSERVTELPAGYLGLDWRLGASRVVTGNFDGTHGDDVMLQSRAAGGAQTVVLSDALGTPALGAQTWRDGYLGRHWSASDAKLYTGDFDGDTRADLLVQVLNDDLFAAPYRESAYALLLADEGGVFSRINTTWDRDDLGADWDPAKVDLEIGDYDGDGIADIALMARALNGRHSLVLGTPKGVFTDVVARWRGTATPAEAYAQATRSFAGAVVGTSGELQLDGGKRTSGASSGISAMSFTAGTPAVGALAGHAGVSGGAATYSIPIVVPPGRAGMQPSVSVGYSSRAGNGELGMGWSLNVGSGISRCARTAALDGQNLSVKLDSQDRLCLDGQRLVLVSGTYGATGAVYRTELESYVRVEQTGAISSTTSSFTAKYDDGRVAYYGETANSRHIPDAANVLTWLLRRVQDPATNSVLYNYTNAADQVLLADITYTGRGTTAGDRKVMFTWEDRPDDSVSYLAGSATRQTKRLSMISTWYTTLPVREYRFSYETAVSAATARSLLKDVEECAYQASTLYCLPKTQLAWQASASQTVTFNAPGWATANDKTSDQKAARITLSASEDPQTVLNMLVGAPSSAGAYPYEISPGASFVGKGTRQLWYQSGDPTTGTAKVQMLRYTGSGTVPAVLAPPSGMEWPIIGEGFWEYMPQVSDQYGDFNNDGRTDFGGSQVRFVLVDSSGNPTGWQTNDAKVTPGNTAVTGNDKKFADFDGDGKLDIVVTDNVAAGGQPPDYRIFLYRNVTSDLDLESGEIVAFEPRVEIHNPPEYSFEVAGVTLYERAQLVRVEDVNGDGRPDIAFKSKYHSMSSTAPVVDKVLLNEMLWHPTLGLGYTFTAASSATTDPADNYLSGDVNGDGLLDVVHREASQANWRVKINKGSSYATSNDTGVSVDPIPCGSQAECAVNPGQVGRMATRMGDVDNDGRDELLVPVARVATICWYSVDYIDGEGQPANESMCGNKLFKFVPDNQKFDASIYEYAAYRLVEASPGDWVGVDTGVRFKAPGTGFTLGDANGDGLNDLTWAVNRNAQMYYSNESGCSTACSYTFPKYGNYLSVATQTPPDMLVQVTDGFGRKAAWTYDPLSNSSEVTLSGNTVEAGGDQLYALAEGYEDNHHFHFTSTMYVVSEFWATHHGDTAYGDTQRCAPTCEAGWYARKYAYRGAMYNNQGRGFMGFRTVIEEDPQRQIRTINTFHQKFPWAGQLEKSVTERTDVGVGGNGRDLSKVENTFLPAAPAAGVLPQAGVNYTPFQPLETVTPAIPINFTQAVVLASAISRSYDPGAGTLISETTTTNVYPATNTASVARGCMTSSTSVTDDQLFGKYTSITADSWTADKTATWWICKLTSRTATTKVEYDARHGEAAVPETTKAIKTDYTYNSRRQPLTEIVGPATADATLTRTTTYTYEDNSGHVAYGNLKTVTVSGGSGATAITSRTTTTAWSADGYFVQTVTNPLGHIVTTGVSPLHGQPTGLSDPNGIDTVITYDAFGRKTAAQTEALPMQSIAYTDCPSTCDSVARSRYKVTTTQSGTPTQTAYFDAQNRTIRAQSQGFGASQTVVGDTTYDHKGRVKKATEPFYLPNATPPATVTNTFDALDRPLTVTDAKGLNLTYVYTGLITAVTASDGTISQTTTTEKNALGQLITSIDHNSNKTHFRYDALGNPVSIKDAIGATVTAVYNAIGQKTSLSDPDMGSWTYAYDVLGNLKTQTDAKAQVTTFVYNTLNQMTSRTEPSTGANCGAAVKGVTTWTYGSVAPDIGLLTELKGCDGVNEVKETPTRDSLSRVTKLRTSIGTANYDVDTTYDSLGRVDTVAYPDPYGSGGSGVPGAPTNPGLLPETSTDGTTTFSWGAPTTGGAVTEYRVWQRKLPQAWGTYSSHSASTFSKFFSGLGIGTHEFKVEACNASGCTSSIVVTGEVENGEGFMGGGGFEEQSLVMSNPTRFIVKQVYNAQGYLSQVRDLTTDALYWQADALNQYGAIQNETLGNGRTTTRTFKTGTAFVESIITNNNTQNLSYLWSAFGHLTKRTSNNSGITPNLMEEQFTYDVLNRLDTAQVRISSGSWVTVMDMAYDATGNITQKIDTTGTKNYTYHATKKHAVITAGATSYTYDNNGNMLTRGGVTQTWDAANFPTVLTNGTYSATFNYGPSRARYKQVATYSGRTETTTYIGSLYEKFTKTTSTDTEHRYLVTAGGLPVAKVTDVQPASGSVTRTTTYLHRDHLGSVDTITDEAGAVLTRMSFDAHGNRRAALTAQGTAWQARLTYASNAATVDGFRAQHNRGFTDHEMLDNVGLVHMNGRVYDPAIGRFMSVDPVFQVPENTQSMNPYTYVLNQPLSLTDPTGYMFEVDPSQWDNMSGGRFGSMMSSQMGMMNPGGMFVAYGQAGWKPMPGGGEGDGPTPSKQASGAMGIAGGISVAPGNGNSVRVEGANFDMSCNSADCIGSAASRKEKDGDSKKEQTLTKAQADLRAKMEEALKDPEVQKMLHAIRQAEFNKDSVKDKTDADMYALAYGFKKLDNLNDHPAVQSGSTKQQYSGAYQIGKNTWLAAKKALGLSDFSAGSQDLAAAWLIHNRGQLDNVKGGNWGKALPSLAREWASLPQSRTQGSYYNQPYMKFDTLKAHYEHYK